MSRRKQLVGFRFSERLLSGTRGAVHSESFKLKKKSLNNFFLPLVMLISEVHFTFSAKFLFH